MGAVASLSPLTPEMPQDVSRAGRWGLLVGVIALHAGVAAVVVHSSRQQTVVGEPAPITVALLSEAPVRSMALPEVSSPVVQPKAPPMRAPVTAPPQPTLPQWVARAPAAPQDTAVPQPAPLARPTIAAIPEPSHAVAVAPSASAPAREASVQANATPLDKPVVVSHTAVRYLREPDLKYPRMSARLGEHGSVTLSVVVDERGQPVSATVLQTSGYPRLDAAAQDAVMQVRYVPYTLNGVPQRFEVRAPFTFKLPSE